MKKPPATYSFKNSPRIRLENDLLLRDLAKLER